MFGHRERTLSLLLWSIHQLNRPGHQFECILILIWNGKCERKDLTNENFREIKNRRMKWWRFLKNSLCGYLDVPHAHCSKLLLKKLIFLQCGDCLLGTKIHCLASSPIFSYHWGPYNPASPSEILPQPPIGLPYQTLSSLHIHLPTFSPHSAPVKPLLSFGGWQSVAAVYLRKKCC